MTSISTSVHARNFQHWYAAQPPRLLALLIGFVGGVLGGLLGLGIVVLGPFPALVVVAAALLGLTMLTNVIWALYGVVALILLLPFGTMPFKLGLTPTLLDAALAIFLLVYLVEWMSGKRRSFLVVPPHALIALYAMWLIFAFVLGLRYGSLSATLLRDFASMLLSIGLTFIVVDLLRDSAALRRLVLIVLLCAGVQAVLAVGLFLLPDSAAESLLVRLSRIGYPDGGVIRYIEDNPALGERAIGTWIDPNALGGILAVSAAMVAPQLFAQRPVLRARWLTWSIFSAIALALFLTSSRASFLALGIGLGLVVLLRYRRYVPLLLLTGSLFLLLPQTQGYIERILQAFQGQDLSTQMRIGEWTDSLSLISRFPLTGIGFSGTPYIGLYTDVANMYLIMANQIGLSGVVLFLLAMLGIFAYSRRAWKAARASPDFEAIHLGYHIALVVALLNAIADLYYFRLDFQSSIAWFWLVAALCLASSRLALSVTPRY
ncbi:MAG: O-antigen ligase family protein [Anaerolineae bacterium]|nr:O-antigen ligase family protein [Anaerolineae bacterium]MDW8173200.1 O-antigen ligase family protein [Anaerolineae bacterium]